MRVVVALGGNALLKRGEPMTADAQRANVRVAAESLARIARDHQLVISHGNGPQVGLLALEAAAYEEVEAYPFDILGAETQGMIGYLIEHGVVVICAGGGGIPTMYAPGEDRRLVGIEAVIDKDFATSLLSRELDADLFVMATDVDGVYEGWGTPDQRRIERITPAELREREFAAGSMGPKVSAAMRFVERTGKRAAIGGLAEIEAIVEGSGGTQVEA